MKTLVVLVAVIGLAACANTEVLPAPAGPVFALNTGHWQPTSSDLQVPSSGRGE